MMLPGIDVRLTNLSSCACEGYLVAEMLQLKQADKILIRFYDTPFMYYKN